MMNIGLAAIYLCLVSQVSMAMSLGVVGETFPVAEQSFLEFIETRLQALTDFGEMDSIKKRMVSDVSQHANRPTPVGLTRINTTNVHRYIPRVVLSHAITDMQGNVLLAKGASVNALDTLQAYQPFWLFFNADDDAQVAWATRLLQTHPAAKVILTGGEVGRMEQVLKREIFFDQAGRISHQLEIKHVPAQITRSENALLIEEIAIKEDGYAR